MNGTLLDSNTNFPTGILFTNIDNFMLMESLIAKTHFTGIIPTRIGWVSQRCKMLEN
jgi:hypothetical protein